MFRPLAEPGRTERDGLIVDLRVPCDGVIRRYLPLATGTVGDGLSWNRAMEVRPTPSRDELKSRRSISRLSAAARTRWFGMGLLQRQRLTRDGRVVRLAATDQGHALACQRSPRDSGAFRRSRGSNQGGIS